MQKLFALVAVALLSTLGFAGAGGAANGHASSAAVCPAPAVAAARCHALVVTDGVGNPLASTSPTGLSPVTIKAAYNFPTAGTPGAGKTIAIVDA